MAIMQWRYQKTAYGFIVLGFLACTGIAKAMVTNSPYNTAPIYHPLGFDQFYHDAHCGRLQLVLAPFYQHTCNARPPATSCMMTMPKKVKAGDRLGYWNLTAALLPENLPQTAGVDTAALNDIRTQLRTVPAYAGTMPPLPNGNDLLTKNFNIGGMPAEQRPEYGVLYRLPVVYERFGLRGQLRVDFACGIGLQIKGGLVDYKSRPNFEESLSSTMRQLLGLDTPSSSDTTVSDANRKARAEKVFETLLSEKARAKLAKAYDIDLSEDCGIAAEDAHVQLFWCDAFDCCPAQGSEITVRVAPYVGIGGWIPFGKEEHARKVFALATGNNGFYGITFDGVVNFVFLTPGTNQSIQASFGTGLTWYPEARLLTQRIPIHQCQSGLYPSKTTLKRRSGTSCYFRASLLCEEFITGLSFTFDYVFTAHLRDSIKLLEKDATRQTLIEKADGVKRLKDDSCWRNQQADLGFHYQVTPMVGFGFMAQWHISGNRVFKPVTLLGTASFSF